MTDQKQCVCAGLSLMRDMLQAYAIWLDDMGAAQPLFTIATSQMMSHLRQQLDQPENAGLKAQYQTPLQVIDVLRDRAKRGEEKSSFAMDALRDLLHRDDPLKTVYACGDRKTADVLKEVLHLMAEEDPMTAQVPLDKHYKELTCGSA